MSDLRSPSESDLVAALDQSEKSAARLHKRTAGLTVAVLGFSLASAIAVLFFGFVPRPWGIVGGVSFVVASSVVLAIVSATAKAYQRSFARRWFVTIVVWALNYVLVVVVSTTVLSPAPIWFWVCGAVLVALPGIWFTITSLSQASTLQGSRL